MLYCYNKVSWRTENTVKIIRKKKYISVFIEKSSYVSGPLKFKPMLFTGQLFIFYIYFNALQVENTQ